MDTKARKVRNIIEPQTVLEGAGVKLKRSIATAALDNLDFSEAELEAIEKVLA